MENTVTDRIKNIISSLYCLYEVDNEEEFLRQYKLGIEDKVIDLIFLINQLGVGNTVGKLGCSVSRGDMEKVLNSVDKMKESLKIKLKEDKEDRV